MFFHISHFLKLAFLPPGNILFLFLSGFFIWTKRPKLGKAIVTGSFLSLWLFSTPILVQFFLNNLQHQYAALSPRQLGMDKEAAIVVLEAGLNYLTPEYGEPTVSEQTLIRLRYAAFLHNKTEAPVLVSGNDPNHMTINQTDYMANALKNFFNVPTKWREDRGYNTFKEAIYTTEILKNAGIKKLYLVTQAIHMPRSVYAFQNKDIIIIPAPTGFMSLDYNKFTAFLPSLTALYMSYHVMHEYIGLLWYHMNYRE